MNDKALYGKFLNLENPGSEHISLLERQFTRVYSIVFYGFGKLSRIIGGEPARSLYCVYTAFLNCHTQFTKADSDYEDEFYTYYINIAGLSLCSLSTVKRKVKELIDLGLVLKVREEKCRSSYKRKIFYKMPRPTKELFDMAYRKATTSSNKPDLSKVTEEEKEIVIKVVPITRTSSPEEMQKERDYQLKRLEESMEKDAQNV